MNPSSRPVSFFNSESICDFPLNSLYLLSFYASVECVERELDPLNTNLVVADSSKTEKTICLAVSPSLKQYGIGGRARLFEVVQKVKEINRKRKEDNSQTDCLFCLS